MVRSFDRLLVEPKRMLLDRVAVQQVSQNVEFSIVQFTSSETRLPPAGSRLPSYVFTEGLYVRPPPSSVHLV